MLPDSSHQKILYWLDQKTAKQRMAIKTLIVDSSVWHNAYTLLVSGNILKIHPNEVAALKKIKIKTTILCT